MTAPQLHPEIDLPDSDLPDSFLLTPRGEQLTSLLRAGVAVRRVIDIGRYRRSWTPEEVLWVRRYYLDNAPEPTQWVPTGFTPVPIPESITAARVEITPRQAAVIDGLCRGLDTAQLRHELDLAGNTLAQYIRTVMRSLGAETPEHAAELARTGWVHLFVVERRGGRPATGQRAA